MGDLVIDPITHTVERGGRPIDLTPKEFALLEYLMYHTNRVVTCEMIEQHIWNYDFVGAGSLFEVRLPLLSKVEE
jgi:DNA-binding response OmpR family regulator